MTQVHENAQREMLQIDKCLAHPEVHKALQVKTTVPNYTQTQRYIGKYVGVCVYIYMYMQAYTSIVHDTHMMAREKCVKT